MGQGLVRERVEANMKPPRTDPNSDSSQPAADSLLTAGTHQEMPDLAALLQDESASPWRL